MLGAFEGGGEGWGGLGLKPRGFGPADGCRNWGLGSRVSPVLVSLFLWIRVISPKARCDAFGSILSTEIWVQGNFSKHNGSRGELVSARANTNTATPTRLRDAPEKTQRKPLHPHTPHACTVITAPPPRYAAPNGTFPKHQTSMCRIICGSQPRDKALSRRARAISEVPWPSVP